MHHTAKNAEGSAYRRLRGHSSLYGAADGVLEFVRAGQEPRGRIIVGPKDGEVFEVPFTWDSRTFLLGLDDRRASLTPQNVADVVRELATDEGVTAAAVCEATGYLKSAVTDALRKSIALGLIRTNGARARAIRYLPTADVAA